VLKTLSVSNFALIEHAGIEFSGGLNILTGETGAGKSILVDALNTVLGSRASADFIRSGSDSFRVEAVFEVDANPDFVELLADQGIPVEDDGTLIISRQLNRQGKSVILVNGCHVTLGVLRRIGGELVDMHGQHENQALLKPESHLELLDAYDPKIREKLHEYRSVYNSWTDLNNMMARTQRDSRERAQRVDMLKWQVDEIAAAALNAGEEETLSQEIRVLANAEKIMGGIGRTYGLLSEGGKGVAGILSVLADAKKELETVARYDPHVETHLAVITDVLYQLEETAVELRDYCESIEFNPQRLAGLHERMDVIHRLKKKYGSTLEEVIDYYHSAVEELNSITNYEERVAAMSEKRLELEGRLAAYSAELDVLRRQAAAIMAGQICDHLIHLGMPKAKLIITVNTIPNYLSTGANEVAILFSANPGEEPKPLQKIASGGELSRIALAIKTVSASRDRVSTMVFDEVDAGVGGQTAQMVAEKIALVSRNKQVLCITHLPQIAAMADYHIYVEKTIQGDRTKTSVKILAVDEHLLEVTRMISGDNVTKVALQNASEMIDAAMLKKGKMESRSL
jgi:DNA repair protein RecN (Recombination protein N)